MPGYLSNIIPPTTRNVPIYHTRNSENYFAQISGLELIKESFIPDIIRKQYFLKSEVREFESISLKNSRENITESLS